MIDKLIPAIRTLKYEEYTQNKSKVIFTPRQLSIEGHFTLTQSNAIVHVSLMQTTQSSEKVCQTIQSNKHFET